MCTIGILLSQTLVSFVFVFAVKREAGFYFVGKPSLTLIVQIPLLSTAKSVKLATNEQNTIPYEV
jgi:hypothetical protein